MQDKIKVVCPKCQAKINLPVEKMKCEVVKFRCPGCSTILRARKPSTKTPDKNILVQSPEDSAKPSGAVEEMQNQAKEIVKEIDMLGSEIQCDDTDREVLEPVKKQIDVQVYGKAKEERLSGSDLRKFKRVKFKQKVLVDNQIMVEALDISENGLFLHTGRSFDDGAVVEVGIPTLPGNFELKVYARVQHNHSGIGMGMQFVDLGDKQKQMLEKLIYSLDVAAQKELEGRKIILLAGGSDIARNINKSKLVLDGFYVLQATNADDVFDILKNETPDAMVLDWQETSFYSKGLLTQIRQTPQYDNVIIIVLAALTDASVQREILDAGAERYMAKMDTNPAKLSQTLSTMIEERDG